MAFTLLRTSLLVALLPTNATVAITCWETQGCFVKTTGAGMSFHHHALVSLSKCCWAKIPTFRSINQVLLTETQAKHLLHYMDKHIIQNPKDCFIHAWSLEFWSLENSWSHEMFLICSKSVCVCVQTALEILFFQDSLLQHVELLVRKHKAPGHLGHPELWIWFFES